MANGSISRAIEFLCHLGCDDGDFVARLRVLFIEETARENDQVAHKLVFGINPQNPHVAFLAAADGDAFIEGHDRRRVHNSRYLNEHGIHIFYGERVRVDIGDALSAAHVLRENQVGADGLDLVQDVLLTGHANGDYENQRCGPYYHAESSQRKTYFVAAKGVIGESEDFPQSHFWPQSRTHRRAD